MRLSILVILIILAAFGGFAQDSTKAANSEKAGGVSPAAAGTSVAKDPEAVKRAEAARKLEELRKAEEAKKAEITRKIEIAKKAEEAKKAAEAKRKEEAKKKAETKEKENEKKRIEAKKAEDARKVAEAKKAEEARKIEDARKVAEAKKAEEARKIEDAKKVTEAKKAEKGSKDEDAKKVEEAKKAEEARLEAEVKKAEEELKAEEAKAAVKEAAAGSSKAGTRETPAKEAPKAAAKDAKAEEPLAVKKVEKTEPVSGGPSAKPAAPSSALSKKPVKAGPVTIIFGRPINTAINAEEKWLPALFEAILEYKLAAIPDLIMISPDTVSKYLPAHKDLSVTPEDADYMELGKKLKTDYIGIQKFEIGRDKSVFYYLEITSVARKMMVSSIERTFKLKKLGTELDEIVGLIMREFSVTPPRELARFLKIPAIDENMKIMRSLGEAIVKERYGKATDSVQLADEYRSICERGRKLPLAYYRAGLFFVAMGRYNDAAEAFNLHFLALPEYLPAYIPFARSFRKARRFEDAVRIAMLGEKRGIQLSELTAEKALAFLEMGKPKEAQDAYKQILEINPNDPYALLFYAKLNNDSEKPKEALVFIDRLLKAKQHVGSAYLEQGRSLVLLKRGAEAVEALSKAVALLPNEIEPVIYLGDAQFTAGKYDKALELFEQALQKTTDNIDLYIKAAQAADRSGDRKKALAILKKIEERFSNHGGLQRELGLLELADGDSTRARVHLEASMRSGAEDERVLTGLGWIYLGVKELDKAAVMFNKAMTVVKDKNQCKVGLAMVHIKKGETKKAVALIDEVSAANLKLPGINGMLGDAMVAKGEKKNALVYYRKERTLGTIDKGLQGKIADLAYEFEPAKSARNEYEELVKMGGGGGTALYRLTVLSLTLRDTAAAGDFLARALKLGDTDVATWLAIGKGYADLKMTKQALGAYQKAALKDPSKEDVWSAIVALQTKSGNDTAAAEAHLKLYGLNPKKHERSLAAAGKLFEKAGKRDKAKSAYATFIKNNHVDAEINIRLAAMVFEEKNHTAVISLLQSIPVATLGVTHAKMLIQSDFAVGQHANAIPLLKYVISKTPKDPWAYEWAAQANEHAKQYDEAIKMYQKYLMLAGKNEKYAYHLGELLESRGKKEAAIAQYRTNTKLYPSNPKNYAKLANLYIETEDWKRATAMLEKSLTFENASPSLMGLLARAYMAMGRKKEAMEYLRTYIRNAPNDSAAWYELGRLYYDYKEFSNAAKALERAAQLMKRPSAEIYKLIGISRLESGDTVKATGFLENARNIDKNDKEIVTMLATCYRSTGNTRQLGDMLLEQLKLEPDNDDIRMELAEIYLQGEKFTEATRLLEDALGKRGCDVPLHLKLASVYEKQNNQKQWLFHLQEASKCDPKDAAMLYQIGRYYYGQQNRLQAERYLKRALQNDKKYSPANFLLGSILLERKEYKGAGVYLSRAVAIDRRNEEYRVALTEAFYKQGRYQDAYKVIHPVVGKSTIRPDALRWVGLIYKALGNPDTAKQILENALQVEKNCSECLIALGDLYFDEGDFTNAIDRYQRAFDLEGFSRNAAMRLAHSYMKMGKTDQAKALYEKVIAESPTDGEALYRLVNIYIRKNMISSAKTVLLKGGYNKNGWYFLSDAEISEADNNINGSMISYGKALRLIPEAPEVQAGCGRVSLAKRKYNAAIKYFGLAMAGDPENIDYMFGIGQAYEGSGDQTTALELYEEVIRKNPEQPDVHYAMARIYSRAKDHEMAIRHLEEGVRLNKKNPMLFLALGHEYRIMRNTSAAIENYLKAVKIDEIKALEAYRHIGNIYYRSGNEKKAKKYYGIYIKLGGKNKKVQRYLIRSG
ncbi:MAG: tetratricopeptide repeat protein [Chitinispirillaceae bacterium]|nr:tetratricopeptide repeat protein [Chitinispirillaceae bacterium]